VEFKGTFFVLFTLDLVRVLNNRFFTVNFKLLQLVAKHSFDGFALVAFGDRLNNARNCLILKKLNRDFAHFDQVNRKNVFITSVPGFINLRAASEA
jgi:hypothetical protein